MLAAPNVALSVIPYFEAGIVLLFVPVVAIESFAIARLVAIANAWSYLFLAAFPAIDLVRALVA